MNSFQSRLPQVQLFYQLLSWSCSNFEGMSFFFSKWLITKISQMRYLFRFNYEQVMSGCWYFWGLSKKAQIYIYCEELLLLCWGIKRLLWVLSMCGFSASGLEATAHHRPCMLWNKSVRKMSFTPRYPSITWTLNSPANVYSMSLCPLERITTAYSSPLKITPASPIRVPGSWLTESQMSGA